MSDQEPQLEGEVTPVGDVAVERRANPGGRRADDARSAAIAEVAGALAGVQEGMEALAIAIYEMPTYEDVKKVENTVVHRRKRYIVYALLGLLALVALNGLDLLSSRQQRRTLEEFRVEACVNKVRFVALSAQNQFDQAVIESTRQREAGVLSSERNKLLDAAEAQLREADQLIREGVERCSKEPTYVAPPLPPLPFLVEPPGG